MKKILAIATASLMLIGLMAGCATPTPEPVETTPVVDDVIPGVDDLDPGDEPETTDDPDTTDEPVA